jgi:hypothetical protein
MNLQINIYSEDPHDKADLAFQLLDKIQDLVMVEGAYEGRLRADIGTITWKETESEDD